MHHPRTNPTPTRSKQPEKAVRYRTVFVDWDKAGPVLCDREAQRPAVPPARRMVTTVDEELAPLRKNVKDAAEAVLAWLADAISHDGQSNLDEVLDACLRPGPDAQGVNFNALTEHINATLGTDLTAKRVRTAVRHIRKAQAKKAVTTKAPRTLDASLALRERLIDGRDTQAQADHTGLALDLLAAIRSAAGRLIDNDFGEGIPASIDSQGLAQRYASFSAPAALTRDRAYDRLLRTLRDCDGEAESDMRLVLDGSRVVCDMLGQGSLPGVIARLNVLVAGRYLLESNDYTRRLIALADEAEALHNDPATRKLLRRIKELPEAQPTPAPLRVASYCLNNAATHLLDRLLDGRLIGEHHLRTAQHCIDRMMQRDTAFALLRITRLIHAVTLAQLTHDTLAVDELIRGWGESLTLQVLEDLARFDNNELMLRSADHHAHRHFPALARRVIRAA